MEQLKQKLRLYGRYFHFAWQRFLHDACSYRAAALTFTTLLALVPLMSVSFSIFASIPAFDSVGDKIQRLIAENMIATSGKAVINYLQAFSAQAKHLSTWGTFFLIITAVLVLFTAERALNTIWQVRKRRNIIAAFLLYWAVLTFVPLLIGISILFSSYLFSIPWFERFIVLNGTNKNSLYVLFSWLLISFAFTVFYIALPNCRVRLREGLIGGLFAGCLFEIAKWAFAYYVQLFSTYTLLYGAFASFPIFLLWVYLVWFIILFGAELSHALSVHYCLRSRHSLDPLTHAFRWLGYLWEASQTGKTLSLAKLIKKDHEAYQEEPVTILNELESQHFITQTKRECYVLKRDLNELTFWDFYQLFPWPLPQKSIDQRLEILLSKLIPSMKENFNQSLASVYKRNPT